MARRRLTPAERYAEAMDRYEDAVAFRDWDSADSAWEEMLVLRGATRRRGARRRLAEAERILSVFAGACHRDGFGAVRDVDKTALTVALGLYEDFTRNT